MLDRNLLGSQTRYLCGNELTIADYFGAPFVALGDTVRCSYADYPNVARWLSTMKALPSWRKVNEVIDGYAASLDAGKLVSL